ncbi:MAG: toll/interleukin-1 receptor domain-containing protein [Duncaniella sp.]|nr:toll/interleukin-1 receptor domain-containing protein [Duncaniella sp.]
MHDVSNRLFLCYAWEDKARIQKLALEIEHEIQAKVSTSLFEDKASQADESVYQKIADAEIFIVFISDAAKKSDYVRTCVARASHLNKNILPVKISRHYLFFSPKLPKEFKFRSNTYSYYNKYSKSEFFTQLKAMLGIHVEGGDTIGAIVSIAADRDIVIKRDGKIIGFAKSRINCRIRLSKGTHSIQICDAKYPDCIISKSIEIHDNFEEDSLFIPIGFILKKRLETYEHNENTTAKSLKKPLADALCGKTSANKTVELSPDKITALANIITSLLQNPFIYPN